MGERKDRLRQLFHGDCTGEPVSDDRIIIFKNLLFLQHFLIIPTQNKIYQIFLNVKNRILRPSDRPLLWPELFEGGNYYVFSLRIIGKIIDMVFNIMGVLYNSNCYMYLILIKLMTADIDFR